MAKNPFVDGVTNIAIPDSPHGVYMVGHKLKGMLYGIESLIGGDLELSEMTVGKDIRFKKMGVEGDLYMHRLKAHTAELEDIQVTGYTSLTEMEARSYLIIMASRFTGNVDLTGAKIHDGFDFTESVVEGKMFLAHGNYGAVIFRNAEIHGDLSLEGIRTREESDFGNLTVKGHLRLGGAVMPEETESYDSEGLVVGSYSMDKDTRIPDNLRKVLEQYKRAD